MCGIAGFIVSDLDAPDAVLARMVAALKHRGPDGEGHWREEAAALGHRRLSIIDLQGGSQPMCSSDGRYVVVFNGEIYNYLALREELGRKGYAFRTQCDTEVLAPLYAEYGTDMVTKLRGMFAFALWDRKEKLLFAARDRLGQKPFYYCLEGRKFAFASELDSLLECPSVPRELTLEAVRLFLRYGYIPPPMSIYRGVSKLPPASWILFSEEHGLQVQQYWQTRPGQEKTFSNLKECEETLDELLREAVRVRLMSDVPLGAFLSGGLDSSLIVAYMRELNDCEVKTYSIGFGAGSYDESPYAASVARDLGVHYESRRVDLADEAIVERLVAQFGEPFGDSSAIPTFYLSQFTRSHVTVALSGDGGDEIFGGYKRYLGRRLLQWYMLLPPALRRASIGALLRHTGETTAYYRTSFMKLLRGLHRNAELLDETPRNLMPIIFSDGEIKTLLGSAGSGAVDPLLARLDRLSGLDPVEQMMYLDAETYLEGDINVKVDRTSMAHSLEVRSPFLDHHVVEFMARVPLEWKLHGWTGKYLLRRVAQRLVPRDVITRPKHGFAVPMGDWFNTRLKERWEELVRNGLPPFIERKAVEKIWGDHRTGRRDEGYRLWHLLVLSLWWQNHNRR